MFIHTLEKLLLFRACEIVSTTYKMVYAIGGRNLKTVIIALALEYLVLCCISCATTSASDYEPKIEIVEAEGQAKDELFRKMNTWAVRFFKDANSAIDYTDKDEGVISGKAYMVLSNWFGQPVVAYTLFTIECKDEKCRMTLELLDMPYFVNTYGRKVYQGSLDDVEACYQNIITEFKKEIKANATDW